MKKMMRRATAMTLVVSMLTSIAGIIPAFAASSSSEWQIAANGSDYAYYQVDENTSKIVDGSVELADSVTNTASNGGASVQVSKTIESTKTENQFDITLEVVTTQSIEDLSISPDAAVVLVFDNSISMGWDADGNSTFYPKSGGDYGLYDGDTVSFEKASSGENAYWDIVDTQSDADYTMTETTTSGSGKNQVTTTTEVYYAYDASGNGTYNIADGVDFVPETNGGWDIGDTSRLVEAKEAAATFVNNFAESTYDCSRYVSIVNFALDATQLLSWTDMNGTKSSKVTEAIEDLDISTKGGTNIEAGLYKANSLLSSVPENADGDDINSIYVVLLSDGAPTAYGTTTSTQKSTSEECYTGAQEQADSIKDSAILYTVAFAEGNSTTNYNSMTVSQWLSGNIATSDDYHIDAADGESLNIGFSDIMEYIERLASAWMVTDPMGSYISLVENTKTDTGYAITGSDHVTVTDGTIKWDLKNDAVKKVNDSYTYTLTYTVQLDTAAQGFAEETYYLTNGRTYLEYFFTTSTNGNSTSDENSVINFHVPAVMGEFPLYSYTVNHNLQTGIDSKGEFEYEVEDTDGPFDVKLWTALTEDEVLDYVNKYTNYTFNANTADVVDGVQIVVDEQEINLYYTKDTTSAMVNHYYYTRTQTDDGIIEELVDTDTINVSPLYIDEKYTATASEGQGYTLEASESINYADADAPSVTNQKGKDEVTITLIKSQDQDGDGISGNNIVNFYYYTDTIEERSQYTIDVTHVYTDYAYELVDGRYELVKEDSDDVRTVNEATVTQYYGTNFTAIQQLDSEGKGYDLEDIKTSGSFDKNKVTLESLTKNSSITLYYEYQPETIEIDETEAAVIHNYYEYQTYINELGQLVEDELTYVGTEIQRYTKYYVGEQLEAKPVLEYNDKNYDDYETDSLTMTLAAPQYDDEDQLMNNTVVINYYRDNDMLAETAVTVKHFYTLYTQVIDEETGEVSDNYDIKTGYLEEIFPTEDDILYVGEFFTASPVNSLKGKNYVVVGTTGYTVELVADEDDNVIEIYYELTEDLGDAQVTVTHTYYTTVKTYADGAVKEVVLEAEMGDQDVYEGSHGERIDVEAELDFDSAYDAIYADDFLTEYVRTDSNNLTVRLDEMLEQQIDLTYSRTIEAFVPTTVTVNHIYTTYTTTVDGDGDVVVEIDVDTVEGEAYAGTVELPLYAGMGYTAELVENGFVARASNQTSIILVEAGEDNIINLYYDLTADDREDATVQVIHHYTTNTITLGEDGTPETTSVTSDYKEGVIAGKYAGQFFTATPAAGEYELISDESEYTEILLVAGDNTIHINYVRTLAETLPATLEVTHIYTTYNYTGSTIVKTFTDLPISGWSGATLVYATDDFDGLYELVDTDSDNDSVDEDEQTIVLEPGLNEITIEYERENDDRTPIGVTVNHSYYVNDDYTDTTTFEGNSTASYTVYMEESEKFTADLVERFGDYTYEFESGDKTIELDFEDASCNVIYLTYVRYIDTTPQVEDEDDNDNGGGSSSSTKYYTLTVHYENENGKEIAESEYTTGIKKGTTYTTEEKEIDGYAFVKTTGSAPSGTMISNKTVTYVYAEDEIEIPDEDVPTSDVPETETPETPEVDAPEIINPDVDFSKPTIPEVEVSEAEIPLSDVPEVEVPEVEIPEIEVPEVEVPLSDIPQTGDSRNLALLVTTALLSAAGLVVLMKQELDEKKKVAGK